MVDRYGAVLSTNIRTKIGEIVELEGCDGVISDPDFKQMRMEASVISQAVVQNARTHGNKIINAVGKAADVALSDSEKLAHIIQGMEVAVLMEAVRRYSEDILLLCHDGFIARRRIDVSDLEKNPFGLRNDGQFIPN